MARASSFSFAPQPKVSILRSLRLDDTFRITQEKTVLTIVGHVDLYKEGEAMKGEFFLQDQKHPHYRDHTSGWKMNVHDIRYCGVSFLHDGHHMNVHKAQCERGTLTLLTPAYGDTSFIGGCAMYILETNE